MKFQFSLARLLLATAGFAFVLGIMKPLKLARHPLVLISASAVAAIVLIATRKDFQLKGAIAIFFQIIDVSLFVSLTYLRGPWGTPSPWNSGYRGLADVIVSLLSIFMFPLGYLDLEVPVFLRCLLWPTVICGPNAFAGLVRCFR
jgi:hypothetical protein